MDPELSQPHLKPKSSSADVAPSTVVGLHGNTVHDLPARYDKVVDELRSLLQRAEAGEVIGIAFATFDRDLGTTAGIVGKISAQLAGRVFTLATKLATDYESDDD